MMRSRLVQRPRAGCCGVDGWAGVDLRHGGYGHVRAGDPNPRA